MITRRGSIVFRLLLLGIAVLAAILRVPHLGDSLWLDELHTAWTVGAGLGEVPQRAAIGNQSPLYFGGVWVVVQLLGLSEASLRLPSVVAGVLLVAAAGVVARRWTGSRSAACLAAWLLAVDPTCLYYAQEARPYAWVQLVGLLQAAVFFETLRGGGRRWRMAVIALSLLAFYLHYTAALLLLAEGAALVLLKAWPGFGVRYRWRQGFVDGLLVLLGSVAAWPHLGAIAQRRENWAAFVHERPLSELATAFFPLWLCGTLPLLCVAAAWLVTGLGRLLVPGTGGEGPSAGAGAEPERGLPRDTGRAVSRTPAGAGGRNGAALLFCLCWLFIPLLITWATTHSGLARLFFLRYLLVATAAPPLLAAGLVRVCPDRYWRGVACLTIAAAAVHLSGIVPGWFRQGRVIPDRNQDWRAAVAWVNRQAPAADGPVLIRSGLIESEEVRADPGNAPLRAYCLLPANSLYPLDVADGRQVPLPIDRAGRLSGAARGRIQSAGQAWLLLAGGPRTVQQIVADLVASWPPGQPPPRVAERVQFGAVGVVRLEVP